MFWSRRPLRVRAPRDAGTLLPAGASAGRALPARLEPDRRGGSSSGWTRPSPPRDRRLEGGRDASSAYSRGGDRGKTPVPAPARPVFEEGGVDLVLAGHDHNYQRFARRDGVTYVVHGGGGAELYPLEPCPGWFPRRVEARKIHGWLDLRATEGSLRVRAVSREGEVWTALDIPLAGILSEWRPSSSSSRG